MNHLVEGYKVVELLPNATDAAGRTGVYFSMKDALRAFVVVSITQGNAATIALTPKQATAVAGTSAKALVNAVPIWANLDTAASDALVRATSATSYTTDAGVKNKQIVFQIDADKLDVNNGFDCIALTTGASNVANITGAVAYLESRYGQVTPITAATD